MAKKLTIGSLFSGIGGLEEGLEQAGLGPVLWQVEADPWRRERLAERWPDADRSVEDVRDAGRALPQPDLLCGGFPCQDLSPGGQKRGLSGARSGLAFELLRVVEEVAPAWVLIENTGDRWRSWVPALRGELAGIGFASIPLQLYASEVGAPHTRWRAFVVAHRDAGRLRALGLRWVAPPYSEEVRRSTRGRAVGEAQNIPSAELAHGDAFWGQGYSGPVFCGLGDGHAPPDRARWQAALGDAVVPEVARVIGEHIRWAEGEA